MLSHCNKTLAYDSPTLEHRPSRRSSKIAVIGSSESNEFAMHHFILGVPAVWLGLAGVLPEFVVGIYKAAIASDIKSAKELSAKLATYANLYVSDYPEYVRYYKACMTLRASCRTS